MAGGTHGAARASAEPGRLLLETRTPLTFEQIRETLEPYRQEKVDTAKRMFERDKDILRDYGVPLELVDTDVWGAEQGYVIPKDAYYLPEIAFTPEELAALFVAAQRGRRTTPRPSRPSASSCTAPTGGVLAGLAGGRSPPGRTPAARSVMAAAAAAQDAAAFGSATGRPRARPPNARSTRTRCCAAPATGTWSASTRARRRARVPPVAVHERISRRGRGQRSRPTGSAPPITSWPGPWTAAGEDARDGRVRTRRRVVGHGGR